ncbi:MAG: hypothetical protein KF847_12875 [Pirellulales bacterium]|nr:hypothetical protein [Pirellulales bacterium]
MRRLLLAYAVSSIASVGRADETLPPGPAFPTESAVVASDAPVTLSAAEQRLHDYLYFIYPQYVAALQDHIQLAQREVDVLAARVKAYRPFESFRQNSPTWTAEQDAQLALLAAEQRLRMLRRIDADLWIYHRANIARLTVGASCVQ